MINKITLALAALFTCASAGAQNSLQHSTISGNGQDKLSCQCLPAVHSEADLVMNDTVTCSNWNGNDWDYDTKRIRTFDINGHLLTETTMHWNPLWVNDTLKTSTYNGNGNITTLLKQYWTGSVWRDDRKTTYTYSGTNLTNELKQWWTGLAWKNLWQKSYTYDGNNNTLTYIYQTWNQGTNVWDNQIQYQYAYDGNNYLTSETILDGNLTTWQNQSLNTYTNNSGGHPLIIILQQWNGSSYANANRTTYVYNGSGQTTSMSGYSFIGGSWQIDYRETTTYDGNGNIITFTNEEGNGGVLYNDYKDTYTYTGNNWDTRIHQTWDGNYWVDNRAYYAQWDGNNQVSYTEAYWDGNNWIPDYDYTYSYDINNRLQSSLNRTWSGTDWVNVRLCEYGYDAIITGISNVKETPVSVYPNPFHNNVTFETNIGSKQVQMELYDYSGRLLINTSITQRYLLDRTNMASGIYFYRLLSPEGIIASGKLVAE